MCKLFRLSESLGKKNGRKRSQIWKLLLIKDEKSPGKKSFFFSKFCLTSRMFLVWVLLSASVDRFFVSCMGNFLDNVHHSLYVTSHILLVTCHISCVTCHMSHVTCHMSHVTRCISHVTCHMSLVTCQVSHVTCNFFGGRSVIKGAYSI